MKNGLFQIGLVGCGGMGSGHAIALHYGTGTAVYFATDVTKKMYNSEVTTDISKIMALAGVYDIDPETCEWAKGHGMFVYENYDAMLADPDVDAILIATPNNFHKEQAIKAMRAGKHVLCEKPVMITSQDLLDVMAVSKETGMVFYPRQNREWDEDNLVMKKIYDEKLIGEPFHVECRIMGSRGIPGDWRGIKECGGGMMLDWGVHIIDRLLKMIPEKVTEVFAKYTYITNKECEDGLRMHLTFESGMTAVLEVGTCHFISLPLWTMYGNHGSAVINKWRFGFEPMDGKIVRLTSWEDKDTTPILAGEGLTKTMAPRMANSIEEKPLPEIDYDRNELYKNFAMTCMGKEEQIVTQEHALRVLRLMEACSKSNAEGVVVKFEQ